MAHSREDYEKVKYVGDSRIRTGQQRTYGLDYSAFPGKTERFFPDFLLREWMVGVVVLVGFMSFVFAEPAPLEDIADPTNTAYVPLPDWYFLFLYQLLKYPWSSGSLTPIGTVVVPGIAFTALILAPWLDKGRERIAARRPIATGAMLIAITAVFFLTWAALDEHAKNELAQGVTPAENTGAAIVDKDSEGYNVYQNASCIQCHATDMTGGVGPSLLGVGDRLSADEIRDIIDNGSANGAMPPQGDTLDDADEEVLVSWLAIQKADEGGGEGATEEGGE